jgi:hypothetical protein
VPESATVAIALAPFNSLKKSKEGTSFPHTRGRGRHGSYWHLEVGAHSKNRCGERIDATLFLFRDHSIIIAD